MNRAKRPGEPALCWWCGRQTMWHRTLMHGDEEVEYCFDHFPEGAKVAKGGSKEYNIAKVKAMFSGAMV